MRTIKKINPHKGFTLIELMITVAIISIIAAIAIPSYNGYIATAYTVEAKNNIAALKLAQEEYFLENNKYFTGANISAIKTASGGLWNPTPGSGGVHNFSYAVSSLSPTTTWSVTATGSTAKTSGETITVP